MANLSGIAAVAHPLEKLVKELRAYQVPNNEKISSLIEQGYALINTAIADPEQLELTSLPGSENWSTELEALHNELVEQAHANGQSGQGPNPEALTQFMSQGMDSLFDAESLLQKWQEEQDEDALKPIRKDLPMLPVVQLLLNCLTYSYSRIN